jgi:alpha-ketoglutarate-dependent taurine dioxygenase
MPPPTVFVDRGTGQRDGHAVSETHQKHGTGGEKVVERMETLAAGTALYRDVPTPVEVPFRSGTSSRLAPLREAGMSGFAAMIERLGASVWFDDRWLVDEHAAVSNDVSKEVHNEAHNEVGVLDAELGGVEAPVVVFHGEAPVPAVPPSRRSLVIEKIVSRVDCVDPTDPLVVARGVNALGVGAFEGRVVRLPSAGRVEGGSPLLKLRSLPVAVLDGAQVRIAGSGFLGDGLLGAEDNAALVSFALAGSVDAALVGEAHAFRVSSRRHQAPPTFDLAGESWDFDALPDRRIDLSSDEFARVLRRNVRRLPASAFDALLEFADEGNDAGALLLRGFQVGDLPPTPESPRTPFTKDLRSEMTLLTVGRLLGQPVGYLPENNGNVVQNIVPTREGADRQVSTSSAVNLAWHTEAAFHPHRPRFLLLFCLRGDAAARTTLCSVREIVDALPLRTRALLASPRFRTRADESYVRSDRRPLGRLTSVLGGDPRRPTLVFDADLMVGQDAEAQAALRELAATMERSHTSVVLAPGDLLVVDNTVAVHGRSPFTPRFDGTDRWLQRTFVVSDLAASAGERSGRVIRTLFTSPD